jgi:hypothetical protein
MLVGASLGALRYMAGLFARPYAVYQKSAMPNKRFLQ